MIAAHYRFPRGSSIVIPLDFAADDGETTASIYISAWLRFAGQRAEEVTADMVKVAEFTVEPRSRNEGWFLRIPDSSALEPGFYLTDIRMEDSPIAEAMPGGDVLISDRLALIEITLPVTGAS